ncbi:MAG: hypothetical protein ABJA74_06355 [Lapillicoccus sp.]
MSKTATRMQQGKERARQVRLHRLADMNARDARIAEAADDLRAMVRRSDAARAYVVQADADAARALARLTGEGVLLRDIVELTGVSGVECRRLLRVARRVKAM